ncbi:MAG: glycosyltransferase family 2 protein [Elusimicrobiota bacterium]|nr:MAG: glycosyltransferase family 2 protein [Elusimicrobiota bacterium]
MGAEGSRRGRPQAHDRLLPQSPLNSPLVSVVLPCHNEAGNIARYGADLFPALDGLGVPYEVILVDDGSTDGTAAAAASLLITRRDVKILSLSPNRGMGGALRAGFAEAQGEWVATLDADLTFPPAGLKRLLEAGVASKADLVSGSPYLRPGDLQEVAWLRRLPSLMVNAFYRGVFGRALTAYTPVMRLYRATFLRGLDIRSTGFEINAEIAARAMIARRPVVEVPVPLRARTAGVSKLDRGRELRRHLGLVASLLVRR